MANYQLTQTGAEVQTLLDKVENAATSITGSSALATDSAVKNYVDSQPAAVSAFYVVSSSDTYTDLYSKYTAGTLPVKLDCTLVSCTSTSTVFRRMDIIFSSSSALIAEYTYTYNADGYSTETHTIIVDGVVT